MATPLPSRNRNLLFQIAAVFVLVSVCAAVFIFMIFLDSEESSGKGSAINVAGSLRMQSYIMALAVANSEGMSTKERTHSIEAAVTEFNRRLTSPELQNAIPKDPANPLRQDYQTVRDNFYSEIKPLAESVIVEPSARFDFLQAVPVFVQKVDRLVVDLENGLENKVDWLKVQLAVTMLMAIFIGSAMIFYLNRVLFSPLHNLAGIAAEVRKGNFSVRARYRGNNEISELCESFNFMIEDLSRLYGSLAEQVRIKTEDLDRSNKALSLLYSLRSLFAQSEMDKDTLQEAVKLVGTHFTAADCTLIIHHGNAASLLETARYSDGALPEEFNVTRYLQSVAFRPTESEIYSFEQNGRHYAMSCCPVKNQDAPLGTLAITREVADFTDGEKELIESVCSVFSAQFRAADQQEEAFRLALYEERSTIARELHDSIAQSLAYARIQLTRLSHAVQENKQSADLNPVIGDLRTGIATAYGQLRELLTTFRLKPTAQNLRQSLREILEDFNQRSSIPFTLENQVVGFELSANQQVHLLQILREALSNVTKHSHATAVTVVLKPVGNGTIELSITDNGTGFNLQDRSGHFGLGIMRERAEALNGYLKLENVDPHGTKVRLQFQIDT